MFSFFLHVMKLVLSVRIAIFLFIFLILNGLLKKSLLKTFSKADDWCQRDYPEDDSEDVMQTIGTKIQSPPFENETLA